MTGTAESAGGGERIARRMARAGVASRRAAEAMIAEGRVAVNGRVITSPALNVTDRDRITVDGLPLAAAEPQRLWRYYKPLGLVTSERDEKGRETVFQHLPEDMPRVVSVGRLDLNSEGLLLLTNDGALKRRLELPTTGWLRKYRVRAHGAAADATLEPLRRGVVVDGERFQPMTVTLDRTQGANLWLTVSLREGRNREVRRALDAVGLTVNRLIRVSYGPFQLGDLEPGAVEEVRPKVLREQLGVGLDPTAGKVSRGKAAGGKVAGTSARAGAEAGSGGKAGAGKPGRADAAGRAAGKAGRGKPGTAGAGLRRGAAAGGETLAGYSQKSQAGPGRTTGPARSGEPSASTPQRPGTPSTGGPRPPGKPSTPGSRRPGKPLTPGPRRPK